VDIDAEGRREGGREGGGSERTTWGPKPMPRRQTRIRGPGVCAWWRRETALYTSRGFRALESRRRTSREGQTRRRTREERKERTAKGGRALALGGMEKEGEGGREG